MSDTDLGTRAERATEGPWLHLPPWKTVPTTRSAIIGPNGDIADRIETEEDAEFIANSRADIPALLDRLDRAEATIARVEAAIRLVSPDHITPQGARIIRAALTEERREQCYKATADRDRAEAALARVRELHQPVEIEPSGTICGHCSYLLPNGRYFGKVEEWPCPTITALNEETK